MTSEIGFNSYKRYKAGTTKFTTWLVGAVQTCGGSVNDISSLATAPTETSSKNSKKSKRANKTGGGRATVDDSKYTIQVKEFTRLAKVVMYSSTNIKVPAAILGLLDDIIGLRKEVSRWLGRSSCKHGCHDHDDGHAYFISVLEQVRKILRPKPDLPIHRHKNEIQSLPKEKITNLFSSLSLDDPNEIGDGLSPIPPLPVKTRDVGISKKVYDVESLHDEVLIASIFFFQDMNDIREYIRNLWSDYRKGTTELTTASLLSNTAIEMIQRSTVEHLDLIKRWPDAPPESNLILWVYLHLGGSLDSPQNPDDLINMETYEEAERVSYPVHHFLEQWLDGLQPHRLTFLRRFAVDLSQERSKMTAREKVEEDGHYATIMATQLHNVAKLRLDFPPATDDLTREFCNVGGTKGLRLWMVLAMQILVDIKGVLRRDMEKCFEALQATGDRATAVVQLHFQTARELKAKKDKWHEDNDMQILKVIQFVGAWIRKDKVTDAIRKHSSQRPEVLGVELQPFFLLKHHPVLCGTFRYFLDLGLQEVGLSLTNAYDTILSTAHLYNAATQLKLLTVPWPDMEFLISIHTPKRIFIGGLPTTSEDFLKRFQLVLGASAVNFARNRRAIKAQSSSDSVFNRRLKNRQDFPMYAIFHGRYCGRESRANLTTERIDSLLRSDLLNLQDLPELQQQWTATRKLNSIQLLTLLRAGLEDEELHLQFDYISMHRRCVNLLNNHRDALIANAKDQMDGSNNDDHTSMLQIDSNHEMTPALFLRENVVPETFELFIHLTYAVFLSDPAGAEVAKKFDQNAEAQSLLLRFCNVSLAGVAAAIADCIKSDGDTETSKAYACCRSKCEPKVDCGSKKSPNSSGGSEHD